MSARPLISIIIPAFNAASVLGDALRSVQQQQYPHFEALVVDDGSADETAAVARSFVEHDQRFVLLQQAHRGISAARNAGLAAARGEWIAFLDADDTWLANKLARQVDGLHDSPEVNVIFSNYYLWDGQNDLRLRDAEDKQLDMADFRHLLIRFNLLGTTTVMVTQEFMSRVGPFDPELHLAEDWDMWLRLAEAGCRALRIREPLARYRIWPGNISRQTLSMAQATVRVLEGRLAQCQEEMWRRSYRRSLAIARGNLEFAAVRPLLDTRPELLPPAALRAWRGCPRRLTWLVWYVALRCPGVLGGNVLTPMVHRKIQARW